MAHMALARKWRPKRFEDLVGQNHIKKALTHSLEKQQTHPAYLFTGTRGVGKTTLARLVSKAINCEKGISANPCGVCSNCQQIDNGTFIDLIEIDAASRTKVDDTRELLENVQYAPIQGRYKVYLIDEVHMLSTHSFNALLKTLEEPPEHVQFLLATTESHKIPVTIISRCVQFTLRKIPEKLIADRLEFILNSEQIVSVETEAVHLISKAADGSLRDALSLLDQALAIGNNTLSVNDVYEMLGGMPATETAITLLQAIGQKDVMFLMDELQRIEDMNGDFSILLDEFLALLQNLARYHALRLQNPDINIPTSLTPLITSISPADVQLFYQIVLLIRRDITISLSDRQAVEMGLLRMLAFQPCTTSSPVSSVDKISIDNTSSSEDLSPISSAPDQPHARILDQNRDDSTHRNHVDWNKLIDQLDLSGRSKQLALNSSLVTIDNKNITLIIKKNCENLLSEQTKDTLNKRLQNHFGYDIVINYKVDDHNNTTTPFDTRQSELEKKQKRSEYDRDQNKNIQLLIEHFDATIIAGSTKPRS